MVRIHWREADLRERAMRLGAIWRPAQKLWEFTWLDVKRLEIAAPQSNNMRANNVYERTGFSAAR